MDLEPWEAVVDLEVDDDSAILRPCKSSSSLIPGPAGAVQAVMRNRRCNEPLPTQEFLRRVDRETDRDFNTNPWLCALQFLGSDSVDKTCSLKSIMKMDAETERVSFLVAFVKSCTPNGFGDMTLTLKDPTATLVATLHRNVFSNPQFTNDIITVGSVLVLHKVPLFSPNRYTRYLNITLDNIVKVFSKDSESHTHTHNGNHQKQQIVARVAPATTGGMLENDFQRQEKQMVNQTISLPHWTEEQLDELLAFD